MYSDLDRARQGWDRIKDDLRALERSAVSEPDDADRREAMLHLTRLRAYIALGRVNELERTGHAHKACEGPPHNRLF
ncbi:hypothetical protein [Methylobacterium nigriterrae]|uniref:hypothetical protein n=1 Tax=Methylobacterium nigriterrae TaxID=3127512 RepID=UPI003013EF1B